MALVRRARPGWSPGLPLSVMLVTSRVAARAGAAARRLASAAHTLLPGRSRPRRDRSLSPQRSRAACSARPRRGGPRPRPRAPWPPTGAPSAARRRAPSAIWSSRSSTCLHQRMKSPADSSAPRSAAAAEHPVQPLAAGPAVDRPDEARARGSRLRRQPGVAPRRRRARPRSARSSASASRTAAVGIRVDQRLVAARLVHQRRDDGGELGRVQAVPGAGAQALGDDQVGLGPDPGQLPPGRRRLVAGEVAALVEQRADPVERAPERAGPALDAPAQPVVLALPAGRAARPSGRAPRGRRTGGTGGRAAPRAAAAPRRRSSAPRRVAASARGGRSGRSRARRLDGEVAALLRRAVVDVLGHPHRAEHVHRRPGSRRVDSRPAQRASVTTSGRGSSRGCTPGVEDDGQPGPAPARHPDDVAAAAAPPATAATAPRRALRALAGQRRLALAQPAAQRRRTRRSRRGRTCMLPRRTRRSVSLVAADLARPARRRRGRPGTARTTPRAARARPARPIWPTRLTAMLYDGRNDERSG